ncbi:MAG: tyrosine-type recombinase/integrase [Mangrovibacterium sp.]
MKRQKLFRAPYLYDAGGDLSKPWWIELGYRDPRDGKMKRKRYQEEISALKTKKARKELADEMINNLTAKLLRGWTPLDDERENQVVYTDELEYHEAARVYGRKRKANKNIEFYANEYITLIKNTKAKKTFESYRGRLRSLIAWLRKEKILENDISTFDNAVILRFFDWLITEQKLSGRTIAKYRMILSKFFRHLIDRKIIVTHPVQNIPVPETDEDYAAVPFLDEDMERIMPIMRDEDPQLYLAAMLQYFCFIRPGDELLSLRVKQLNFTARSIYIPKDVAKKRTARNIDIPAQMYELLIAQGIQHFGKELFVIGPNGRPGTRAIGYNTLRNRFNIIRDRLGLSQSYKWYSFKHTGAGKLLASGATIAELMNQLGHTDIASTYRYIRRHFGERSEHVRNSFPTPPGMRQTEKQLPLNQWMENLCLN